MSAITALTSARPQATPPTDRVELPGSAFPNQPGLRASAANPSQQLQVSLILKSPQAMPEPGEKPMATADHQAYEATPAQLDSVRRFARTNGLEIASVDPETRTVKLQGSVANYQKAFGVKLQDYQAPNGGPSFRAYEGSLSVPRSLANNIEGVFGLSNRPVVRPRSIIMPKDFGGGGYLGNQVGAMYNFPKGVDGTGQTIAILEFGGGYNTSDLQQYFSKAGLPLPKVSAVGVDGVQNSPGVDNDVDGEVALDIEVAGAVAPGANIVVYFAPDTEQGFIDAINTASHSASKPQAVSISWGSPEDSKDDPPPTGWSDAGRAAVNNALKDAANLGVNVYVASGDDGSKDGASDGQDHVDYPSASPYAISVGGTKLEPGDNGGRGSEVAWGDGSFGGASGGGVSNLFPLPDFQQNAHVPAPAQAGGGRGVPDMAGNAAPETGYDVIWDGSEQPVGGTSASAPLMAGMTALLGQGSGTPLGYLNPFYYQHPDAFNDITQGSNGTFSAGPGWDAVTGLGSPDGDKLLAALKARGQG